jgi:ABC-2 type transport system permease protein
MTATTDRPAPTTHVATHGVTFRGLLRSEWIKLRSLRSTFWCAVIIVVLSLGLAALAASTLKSDPMPRGATLMSFAVRSVTLSSGFTSLVAAVLGALVITGEFGTGMIRSTFTAAPRRVPALVAKAIVVTIVVFVIAAISAVLAGMFAAAVFGARGLSVDLSDGGYWLALLGDAGYLALIALLSFAIGALIRNSAGGIATALGLILVLPTVAGLFAVLAKATWAQNVSAFLPSDAGSRMMTYLPPDQPAAPVPAGQIVLEPWQGLLVLLAWIVLLGAAAIVVIRRRDV